MKMTIGKFKGQPVEQMTTAYLAWLITQDHIRFRHWPLIKEALRILRKRFQHDFDALLGDFEVKTAPPERWKTKERDEHRAHDKAAKLLQLEEWRKREAAQRRLETQLKRQAASQVFDGGRYLREMRLQALRAEQARRQQADPNDISDLV